MIAGAPQKMCERFWTLPLRLVTAIVVEISEEWETGRIYINMETA